MDDQETLAPPSPERYRKALSRSARMRRFYERWVADSQFRADLAVDPARTLQAARLAVDVQDIASLLDLGQQGESPGVSLMWAEIAEKDRWVRDFYWNYAVPDDPQIRSWRQRQVARQRLDLGPHFADANIHSSLAIELTKGCSGGCWFCAVSAGAFEGYWPYDERNAVLWRRILEVLVGRLGRAAASGFLYWATDPLDNPYYEQFCLDFWGVVGVFPPTTTALALRDVNRTRALLALAEAHGCWVNRFSVLTLKAMDQIRLAFTEEELTLVECLPLNRGAAFAYGNAGRFRDRALRSPILLDEQRAKLQWAPWWVNDESYQSSLEYPNNSIGCVSGFLVNALAGSIQLISPCTADDRWPLGYYVYDEARYNSAEDFEASLDRLIARHMPMSVPDAARPRLHPWLSLEERPGGGLILKGRFGTSVELVDASHSTALQVLGSHLRAGQRTTAQIKAALSRECGASPRWVQDTLNHLLHSGVLDETPPC